MKSTPIHSNQSNKSNPLRARRRLRRLVPWAIIALLGTGTVSYGEIVDDFDELETATPGTSGTSATDPSSQDPSSTPASGNGASSSSTKAKPDKKSKSVKPSVKPGKKGSKTSTTGSTPQARPSSKVRVVKTAPESTEKTDRNSPITYKADKVLTFKTAKDYSVLNLEKNVFIRQGRLTLSSHRAKVYLRPSKNQANAIDSITIHGNVQVQKSSRIPANRVAARGDKAVFRNRQRTVVLTGNAVVVKGEQVVRGNRISYDLKSGNITISGAKGTLKPGGLN